MLNGKQALPHTMNLKLIISCFVFFSVKESHQRDPCKEVEVRGARYASCSGIYLATNEFKVKWANNKTVYRHVKMDRFIFYNIKPYYWCIGKQSYLETKQFFYYSGINKEEPFSQDNAWKTKAEKSNVSVLCHKPDAKNLTIKGCKYIAEPWTISKFINVVLLAVMLSCLAVMIVFKAVILLWHGDINLTLTWSNQ